MVIEIKDGKQVREERARAAQALAHTAAHESAKEPEITQSSPAAVPGSVACDTAEGGGSKDAAMSDPFGKENYQRMKSLLKERVSPKRFAHSKGVAKTARKLARAYGYPDPAHARMAGLVHDWDKRYVGAEASARADELGVDVSESVKTSMPWLLHGPTGAEALRRQFPELGEAVFQAVARHTSGAKDMTDLDMIVFVADLIEPGRTFQDVGAVRDAVGKVPLEDLFFQAFKTIFSFLVQHDRLLHPDMVEIWNHYAVRQPGAHKGRLSSTPDPKLNE